MVDSQEPIPTHTTEKMDYDQVLNPNGSLPKIHLKHRMNLNERTKGYDIMSDSKTKVGYIVLATYEEVSKETIAYIGNIQIRETFQGNGFGKATYIEILKRLNGVRLKSSVLNQKSRGMWEWLVRNGIARKISDVEGGVYETILPV